VAGDRGVFTQKIQNLSQELSLASSDWDMSYRVYESGFGAGISVIIRFTFSSHYCVKAGYLSVLLLQYERANNPASYRSPGFLPELPLTQSVFCIKHTHLLSRIIVLCGGGGRE